MRIERKNKANLSAEVDVSRYGNRYDRAAGQALRVSSVEATSSESMTAPTTAGAISGRSSTRVVAIAITRQAKPMAAYLSVIALHFLIILPPFCTTAPRLASRLLRRTSPAPRRVALGGRPPLKHSERTAGRQTAGNDADTGFGLTQGRFSDKIQSAWNEIAGRG